jgi:hypothetical protein
LTLNLLQSVYSTPSPLLERVMRVHPKSSELWIRQPLIAFDCGVVGQPAEGDSE